MSLGTSKTKFSAALSSKSEIAVEGVVKGGKDAFITKVGRFDVDLSVEGIVILVRQTDRPGIIAGAALCQRHSHDESSSLVSLIRYYIHLTKVGTVSIF